MERNLSSLECVLLRVGLQSERLNEEMMKELELLVELVKNRDERIAKTMQIMEEKFEKVWKVPWDLVKTIYSYFWRKDDLLRITSKVTYR